MVRYIRNYTKVVKGFIEVYALSEEEAQKKFDDYDYDEFDNNSDYEYDEWKRDE